MDEPSDPKNAGRMPERRAEGRTPLDIGARVVLLDGRSACTIENISFRGARIVSDLPAKVGDQGFLQRGGLDQFFAVNWADEGACGVSFDRELPSKIVRDLCDAAEGGAENEEARLREIGREWVAGTVGHSRDS